MAYVGDGNAIVGIDNVAVGSVTGPENIVAGTLSPPPLQPAETGAIGPTVAVTSCNRSGQTVTVACTAHGLVTGDLCRIAGSSVAAYNYQYGPVTRVDANNYTFVIAGTPSNGTGGTSQKVRLQ